jgi:hypothetical protein
MKTSKELLTAILFLTIILGFIPAAKAQKTSPEQEAAIKKLVDNQRFVFHAESATPLSGTPGFLSPGYIVSVSKDSVISDLPYFGRVYSAPISATEGGIKFTSTKFDYADLAKKGGGWEISIKPKDVQDAQKFLLTVYENGKAFVQASSNSRQSITFNGYIAEK